MVFFKQLGPLNRPLRSLLACICLTSLCLLALTSCGTYNLTGKVIYGQQPFIGPVDAKDVRLQTPGVRSSTVKVTLDPDKLSRVRKPAISTNQQGQFTVPIEEAAGGLQAYRIQLEAFAPGLVAHVAVFDMPVPNQPILIVLSDQHPDFAEQMPGQKSIGDTAQRTLQDVFDEAEALHDSYK